MAILVTGGAGFIGSHTVVELIQAGKEVVIVDNFSNSKPEVLNRIEKITGIRPILYQADLLDKPAIDKIFEEQNIEAVIHFAGFKAVGESVQKPLEYYHNNITGTLMLCQSMREHGCKKIVFSSSATVYGMNNPVPFKEGMPTSATNPYGYTKVMIEQILSDLYVADKEWSVILLRYFNPIGAHESGLIGEDPNGIPNNLLPYIAQVAIGKLPCLSVFGDDYDTVDGTGVRDYIHVVDLALGHLKAIDYSLSHTGVEAINLGTGNGTSVLQILHAFEKACGHSINYKIAPRRAGDIASCYADASKAKEMLGWEATRTIEDMCRTGWNFISKNPNELKKQVGDYLKEKVQQLKKDLIAKAVERNGVKVVVFRGEANVDAIKDLAFQIKGESNTDEKVFFVAGIKDGEKCALMVMLSEPLVAEGLNAGKLVKEAAKLIQGGGGGQPHFATAGGKNVAGLGEAVEHILDAAGLK